MIYTVEIIKNSNRNIAVLPISKMNNYVIHKDNNVGELYLLDEKNNFGNDCSIKSNVGALPFSETKFNEIIKEKLEELNIENSNIDVGASLNELFNINKEELLHDIAKDLKLKINNNYKKLIKYNEQNEFIKFIGTTHSIYSSDFLYIQIFEILKKYFNYNLEKNNLLINRTNEKIDYEISNVLINKDEYKFFISELCKIKNTKINNIMGNYYFKNHKDLKNTLFENYHNIYDVIQFGHQYSYTTLQLKNEVLSEVKNSVYEYSFCEKNNITYFEEKLSKDNNLFEMVFENTTVKPYFDLEMEIQLSHEEQMEKLNIFINYLIKEIKIIYDIDIEKEDFVILDSNSANKLSFHLIINNQIYFVNKDEHLKFIIYLKNRFENPLDDEEKEMVQKLEWIKVDKTGKEIKRFIFDDSVYTTNRLFRCINQSKVGKNNPLKLISNHLILDTLITYDAEQNKKIKLKTCRLNKNFEEDLLNNKKGIERKIRHRKDIIKINNNLNENEKNNEEDENNNNDKNLIPIEVKKDDDGNIIKVIYNKIEYDTIGRTLQEKENKTNEEILNIEPEYLKYLYVIPIQELFAQWINIGMSLKRCKASFEIWDKWSELGDKYLEGDCEKRYKKFETEKGYGLKLLKTIASYCRPDLFNNFNKIYNLLYKLNLDKIEQINDSSQYLNSEYLKTEHKHNIIHAKMGGGKTQGTNELLKSQKYKSCLFLSSRQTFANFVKGEFTIFDNYIGKTIEEIKQSKFLIISIESLQKINIKNNYELIVCDEIETLLANLSSDTMGKRTYKNFKIFKELIKKSKKVLYMDAFISNRTIDFVKGMSDDLKSIKYIKNLEIYNPVNAQEIVYKSEISFEFVLNKILLGKKIYVSFSSNRKLKEFYDFLINRKDENSLLNEKFIKNILIYNSDTTKEESNSLEKINISWKEATMVLTSPKITVGCSYNPEGDRENPTFDLIINFAVHSCTARDMMQNNKRVRNVKQEGMYFAINNSCFNGFDKNFLSLTHFNNYEDNKKDSIINFLKKRKEERLKSNSFKCKIDLCEDINILINYLETNQTDPLLRSILYYNSLELNMSQRYYKKYYLKLLPLAGFKINEEEEQKEENEQNIINNVSDSDIKINKIIEIDELVKIYNNIQNINEFEFQELELKQKIGLTNKDENESIDKYFFTKIYNHKLAKNEDVAKIYFNMYKESFNRKKILNDYFYNSLEEDILKKELFKKLCTEKMDNLHIKNKIIKEIENLIGIEHGNFEQIITIDNLKKAYDYLEKNRKYIHEVFKLRDYKKNNNKKNLNKEIINQENNDINENNLNKEEKKISLKTIYCFVSKLFSEFNGYKLCVNSKINNENKALDYRFEHISGQSYNYKYLTSVTSYEDAEKAFYKTKINQTIEQKEDNKEKENKKTFKIKVYYEKYDEKEGRFRDFKYYYHDRKEKCEEQYEKLLLELHLPDIKVKDEVKIGEKEILNIEMFENNQKTRESLKPDFRIKIKYEKNNIKKLKNKYEYENLYFATKEECDLKYEELFNQLNIIIEKKKLLINKEILEQDKRLEKERLEREKKMKRNKMNMIEIEVYLLNQLQKSQIYQENVVYI